MRAALMVAACATLGAIACATDPSAAYKAIVQRAVDAMNARDFEALDSIVAPNVERHSAATPGVTVRNRDEFKEFLRQDLAAVPDSRQEIEFMVAEGDRVAVYARYSGTQQGQMGPFPATGKEFSLPFIGIVRIEEGKIAEMWVEWDNLSVLSQLGLFAPSASDSAVTSG